MSSPGQLGPLLPYPCVPGLSVPFLPSASTAMRLLVRIPASLSLVLSAARQKCCAVTLSCARAGLTSLPAVTTVLQTLLSSGSSPAPSRPFSVLDESLVLELTLCPQRSRLGYLCVFLYFLYYNLPFDGSCPQRSSLGCLCVCVFLYFF